MSPLWIFDYSIHDLVDTHDRCYIVAWDITGGIAAPYILGYTLIGNSTELSLLHHSLF